MSSKIGERTLTEVVAFHGHLCPGLTTGIRVAEVALREIGPHAQDEEVVAIVETDNCAMDAIQYLTGCTFGKGNLIHLDYGKNAFTFARRSDGKAVRVVGRPQPRREADPVEAALVEKVRSGEASEEEREAYSSLWQRRALAVLEAEEEALFDVQTLRDFPLPDKARLYASVACDACGEMTMESRVHRHESKRLCPPCYQAATGGEMTMQPIGVICNELEPQVAPPRARSLETTIRVYAEYAEALEGIEGCEQLQVLFVFDKAPADAPLRQHPRGDREAPQRGVFTLRSPHRPNPIGSTTVELLRVEGSRLIVSGLDAWNGTPVLDIKPA